MRALWCLGALAAGAVAGCAPAARPAPQPEPAARPEAPRDTLPPPHEPSARPESLAVRAGPPRARAPVRLAFVGDINLGTATLPGGLPPDSGRSLLLAAKPYLAGDLVIGNFEGVLADTGTSEKCAERPERAGRTTSDPRPGCYVFRTPTHLAPRLAEAGFTHLNLANNHANDFGPAGRASTDSTLAALGLRTYGPLGRIVVDTLRRGDSLTVVGVIGFTTYPFAYDLLDSAASAAVVDSVRKSVDLLIVTFHGGAEGAAAMHLGIGPEFLGKEPRGDLRTWAHAVVDAGADLVVGHGPHVLRGLEFYRGKLIAYSLGNFVTYRGFNLAGPLALTGVLQVELGPGGTLAGARLVPMRQLPLRGPSPDPAAESVRLARRLSEEDFGPAAARIADDGTITPP